jgi:hypothetical protein
MYGLYLRRPGGGLRRRGKTIAVFAALALAALTAVPAAAQSSALPETIQKGLLSYEQIASISIGWGNEYEITPLGKAKLKPALLKG